MPVESHPTKRLSVLVVDDDREIGTLIRRNLEGMGIQVIEAASGLDGIQILRQTKVDLVLLDIGLPDFSGWGILSLLRLTEPLSQIPAIMVSVQPPDSRLVDRLKPDDYIQKPFDMRDLMTRMEKVINSRSAKQWSGGKRA